MWQECPVCKGTGEVLAKGFTNSVFQTCKVCNGKMIISKLTGSPPDYEANKEFFEKGNISDIFKLTQNYPLTYEQMILNKNFTSK